MSKKILFLSIVLSSFLFGNTLEQIRQSKVIRVGVRTDMPPLGTKTEDGKYEGFEISLADAIAKKVVGNDVKVELNGVKLDERIPFLQQNKDDLIIAFFAKRKDRESKVDFSIPYLAGNLSVLANKNSGIKSLSDLAHKKIAYVPGTSAETMLKKTGYGSAKIACESNYDCLEKLKNGEADAFIRTNTTIAQLQLVDSNYKIVIPNAGELSYMAVGVAKHNEALRDAVNKAILELSKEGFFKKAYKETFEPFYKGTLDKKYLLLDDLYNSIYK